MKTHILSNFYKPILSFLLFIMCVLPVVARVKLPALVSDGMVLQQNQPLKVWGWADASENIRITFLGKTYSTEADKNGNWTVILPACKAGGPFKMTINDISISDILIGEVWLCSGQSNMDLPMYRVADLYKDLMNGYSNEKIRIFKVPLVFDFNRERNDVNAVWKKLDPENAPGFTAVGYFFAKSLSEKLNVPVGILHSSVGGSPIQAWLSDDALQDYSQYKAEKQIFSDSTLIQSMMMSQRYQQKSWNETLNGTDKGLAQKYWSADFDDSEWKMVDMFSAWGCDGVNGINGSHWLRQTIDLPESFVGKESVLRLGCIADCDSAFINGVFVGSTSYMYPPRKYNIPEGVLKKGKNQLTVKIISYGGIPNFVKDKPYKVVCGNTEVALSPMWKYKCGAQMPQAPSQTFFQYKSGGLYNGMIAPLRNFQISGAVWYQGESNADRYNQYENLLTSLICDWRENWGYDMRMIIVQLPNFMQKHQYPVNSSWAAMRDIQRRVAESDDNAGLAVTIDLGEWNDIHPLRKEPVGARLALQACRLLGVESCEADAPAVESLVRMEKAIKITFRKNCVKFQKDKSFAGFEISADNCHFSNAKAVAVDERSLIVSSESVDDPKIIRYAWDDNPEISIYGINGIPSGSFQLSIDKK